MAVTGGAREGREGGVIRENLGGRLCPGSNSGWQRAPFQQVSLETCRLSCPWPACQTQCSGCIKIRGFGTLGLDKWASRTHGSKYSARHRRCSMLASISKSSWTSKSLSPPCGMRALSLSASAAGCSSLSVSLSLSTAAGRNPVKELNAHLAAVHPQPSRRSRAASTERQAKSGSRQVRSKTSLPRFERGRRVRGDGRGAVHPGQ